MRLCEVGVGSEQLTTGGFIRDVPIEESGSILACLCRGLHEAEFNPAPECNLLKPAQQDRTDALLQ